MTTPDPLPSDPAFWNATTVLVTGGNGFLGRAVLDRLSVRRPGSVLAPTSDDYDLRDVAAVRAMFADVAPDLVIHLAARVGGHRRQHGPTGRPLPRQPA